MKNIKTSVKDIHHVLTENELESQNSDYDGPFFGLGKTVTFNNKEFWKFIENIYNGNGKIIPEIIELNVCDKLKIKDYTDIKNISFDKVSIYVDGETNCVLQLLISADVSFELKEHKKNKEISK